MNDLPELATPKQVAEFLGVTEAALAQDRYLKKGITYVKDGKRIRYFRDDVLAYLKSCRIEVGA